MFFCLRVFFLRRLQNISFLTSGFWQVNRMSKPYLVSSELVAWLSHSPTMAHCNDGTMELYEQGPMYVLSSFPNPYHKDIDREKKKKRFIKYNRVTCWHLVSLTSWHNYYMHNCNKRFTCRLQNCVFLERASDHSTWWLKLRKTHPRVNKIKWNQVWVNQIKQLLR